MREIKRPRRQGEENIKKETDWNIYNKQEERIYDILWKTMSTFVTYSYPLEKIMWWKFFLLWVEGVKRENIFWSKICEPIFEGKCSFSFQNGGTFGTGFRRQKKYQK